jgi:vacuolar protein sorting-associated protein 41
LPSNQIYIATASIDGHVCVASLVDPKDVMLRNFARPVLAVALSPEFRSDRSYLSGGLAGNLILTSGGKSGVSANANTNSAAAAASGWLNSIGLGTNSGRDTILHSGEGTIHMIKWSRSGKFVVWANEHGIKVMRTNIKLESAESESAWTRIAHVDRPARPHWDEMASVWKARAEWIDEDSLEADDTDFKIPNGGQVMSPHKAPADGKNGHIGPKKKKKSERVVIGWGDAVWILQVKSESSNAKETSRKGGNASILHQ